MTQEEIRSTCEEIFKVNAFALHNHVKLRDVKQDYAEVYLDVVADTLNHVGNVHGGAYLTLGDICAGCVARTDGRKYVTQDMNGSFLRGASEGRLTARGTVLRRGRKSCLIKVEIVNEEEKLLFFGTYTYFCVSE